MPRKSAISNAATALINKRWKGDRKADAAVSASASAMGKKRWKGVSEKDRVAHMTELSALGAHLGGRPRKLHRCYCGARTWHSATLRAFDCCKKAGKFPTGKVA